MSSLDESLTRRGSSKLRPPTCSRPSAARLSISKPCWIRSLKLQLDCATPSEEFYFVVTETFTRAPPTTDIRLNFERSMKAGQLRQGVERPLDEPRSKAKRFILPTFSPIPNTHSAMRKSSANTGPISACPCCEGASQLVHFH